MQVVFCIARPSQGKFVLIAPEVITHHEDTDWRSIGIFVLLCGVGAITRNEKFHKLFVFAAIAYEISFFGRYYGTLN